MSVLFVRMFVVSLSVILFAHVHTCLASDIDDTVFLRSGGRIRGVVVSDDAGQVQIRLPSGKVRSLARSDVARIDYGADGGDAKVGRSVSPVLAASSSSTQPGQASSPAEASGVLGALRFESEEPGTIWIDGAQYGETPQVIRNLVAGRHRIAVRFHAGGSESRIVGVQGGTETLVTFETPESVTIFRKRKRLGFGGGVELGIGQAPDEYYDPSPLFRVFGRVNYVLSRTFELRADLLLGNFYGVSCDNDGYDDCYTALNLGMGVRGDMQLNWNSIYAWSLGPDIAIGAKGRVFGGHFSPLSFRFGPKREFLLSVQGAIGYFDSSDGPTGWLLESTVGISYLFL